MTSTAYFTTPIYYVNGSPHIGHAYTTALVDMLTRYHRLLGIDTHFLTGTDEHGDKILRSAKQHGVSAQEWTDRVSQEFRDLWPKLAIEPSDFIRTTEERHKKVVRAVLQDLYNRDEIYSAEYGGWYCTGCEMYYTEKDWAEGKICPIHKTPLEEINEKNWYFRMSKYQDWLIDHIKANPEFIRPEKYRNKVLSFLEGEPLKDLSISRPVERVPWGIPLPFDESHVTYVWFDALINYCSALGWPDGELCQKYWPVVQHVTAKDIIIPHGVYWPTMLKAANIPVYHRLNVHGFWQINGDKMSKSFGSVVNPLSLVDKYGVDAFRFYLAREMRLGNDAEFSEVSLVDRINSELGDDLGNLVKRTTGMITKYCDGKIPPAGADPDAETAAAIERDLLAALREFVPAVDVYMVVDAIIVATKALNKHITDVAPWTLKKNDQTEALNGMLHNAARIIALIGQALTPVMPERGPAIMACVGVTEPPSVLDERLELAGREVKNEVLFQKYEAPEIAPGPEADSAAAGEGQAEPPTEGPWHTQPAKDTIEYDDFTKLDLRAATVLTAERLPKTDKLLKLTLDDGGGTERTIVAGLAPYYTVEEMVGRQVVIVANLAPRKMRGIESQGMLLAANGPDGPKLLTPESVVPNGGHVS